MERLRWLTLPRVSQYFHVEAFMTDSVVAPFRPPPRIPPWPKLRLPHPVALVRPCAGSTLPKHLDRPCVYYDQQAPFLCHVVTSVVSTPVDLERTQVNS